MFGLKANRMRLMLIGIVAGVFLSMTSVCSALEYVWTQKADMPTSRWGHTSAVVNGKIYVIGGGTSEWDTELLSTVEEYDPVNNVWTRKSDMPTAIGWMSPSSAVVDGKIYVIGGDGGEDVDEWCLPTVEEYDPSTDTWTRKADMPTGRDCLATVAIDGKIYAIGGYPPDVSVGLKTVEVYDPVTDAWERKADMPVGLALLNTRVVGGKIYAIGGRPDLKSRAYMQEYDPATDTWTRKADMPVATSQMGSVVLGDKIIVIGGWLWSISNPYYTVQIYDTKNDIWTTEDDAPFQRAVFTAEVVNNRIYTIGGTGSHHPCPATSTVYELTIDFPQPDFNGDGIVDSTEVCIMVDHWGEDYPLCDIAPRLWGDGVIDVEDLKVLAEHFEDVKDPTLIAHWALDESQGDIAYNNASDCDGILIGCPIWQPDGGIVGGSLQFDGIDDYISTDPVLNPVNWKFSVLAWIKGGAPGQVILSHIDGVNWLCVDPKDGCLMTYLREKGRMGKSLSSQTCITDDNWYRIGLVWDGSCRHLYVDGVEVASDVEPLLGLNDVFGGLYIGTGSDCEAGTYFSGLIDDVRIYNRVVSP